MKRAHRAALAAVLTALLCPLATPASPAHAHQFDVLRDGVPIAPDANGALPPGWRNTQWGALGPADIALLEGVRRADLWEGEGAGPMGMQKGQSQRVREVGKILNEQHVVLEAKLVKVAEKLQVPLPTQPNEDQLGWLGQMSSASGPSFDRVWVDLLRQAHGKIFSIIATVRANTRNSLVREFANDCNTFVSTHMQVLESTGLVEFNHLPTPAAPAGGIFTRADGTAPVYVWIILVLGVLCCIGAVIGLVRSIRTR
jgi:hypothetical protein